MLSCYSVMSPYHVINVRFVDLIKLAIRLKITVTNFISMIIQSLFHHLFGFYGTEQELSYGCTQEYV